MNAKEMFENQGYEQSTFMDEHSYTKGKDRISFFESESEQCRFITFSKTKGTYRTHIDVDTFLAIKEELKELGWL